MNAGKKASRPSRGKSNTGSERKPSAGGRAAGVEAKASAQVATRQQAEILAAFKDILSDINKGLPLPELLEAIVERAAHLLNASGGGLYLNEADQRRVRCVVSYKTLHDYSGTVLAYGEGASGRVAETGEPLLIDDYAKWSGRAEVYDQENPFKAVLCAPMKWQNKITGVFTVLRDTKFTRKDLAVLSLFAANAAVVVENARLLQSTEQEFSKRKNTEMALQEAETRYRLLVEQSPVVVYEDDTDGPWRYLSPQLEKLTGYTPEELIHNRGLWKRIIHPDDLPELIRLTRLAVKNSSPIVLEYRIFTRDGRMIWVHDEALPYYEPQSGRVLLRGIFYEVTERKHAEETLRKSEETARSLSEVAQRQAQELSLLDKVRTAIAEELELTPLLNRVVESISETFGYTLVSIYLLEGQELVLQHQVGYDHVIERIPIEQGVTGRVVRTGQAAFLPDVRTDATFLGAISGIRSEVCVPLFDHSRIVGVLNVESTRGVQLSEADLELMSGLSSQIGMAISRARLYEDVRQRNRILSALQESTLALMKQTDLSATLRVILEQAGGLAHCANGYIYLVEPKENVLQLIEGLGAYISYVGVKLKPNEGMTGKIWQSAQPVNLRDYAVWEGRSEKFADSSLHAVLGVPVIHDGRVSGVIGLGHTDHDSSFSDEDLDVLEYFSGLASIALENSGLFKLAQKELAERKQAEVSLQDVETKYRDLVERLPLVVYTSEIGASGRWFYVSPNIQDLLGFSAEEWLADATLWYRQIHPKDRDLHQMMEEQAFASGTSFESEYRIYRRNGSMIWVRDSGIVLPGRDGGLPTVQGVLSDVTERREMREALFESEQRYRLLVDSSPSAIAMHQDGKIVFVNEAAVRVMHAEKTEDLIGKPIMDLVHPEYRQIVLDRVRKAVEDGQPGAVIEEKFLRLDGTTVDVEVSSASLLYRGAPAVQVIVHDITERKQAEEALRKSEALYRQAIEVANAVPYHQTYHVNNRTVDYDFIGEGIRQITGFTPQEFNESVWDSITLERYPLDELGDYPFDDAVQRVRSGESPIWKCHHKIKARDGSIHWVFEAAVELRDENGISHGSIGMFQDITERKQAEEALRLAEEKYRNLIEQIPATVYLDYADESSTSFYVSPQIATLLGYTPEDYIADPWLWHKQIYPDDYESATHTIRNTMREGRSVGEYRLVASDGHLVWVRDSSVMLKDENGNPKFIQGFLEDITERKQAEALQASIYEIAHASMTVQSLAELYGKIHAVLQHLLPTQFFYIAIYDKDQNLVSFPYFQDAYDFAPEPSPPGRGLTEYVLRTRQPILATREVSQELERRGEIEIIGADSIEWLGAPLIVHDQAIGVMVVQSYDESVHFTEKDVNVMTYVSTQVANAIERKRAEEALQRSEAFTRSIVEAEPECVKILGAGGVLSYMNPAGLRMIEAADFESVRGQSVYPIVAPEHREPFQRLTERVLRGEQGFLQFEIIGLKGTRRWLDTHAVPLYDEQGKVTSLLGITRDITDRKQGEAVQDAVYRITKAAETADSITELFPKIHQIISSVMPAENFFITLYDRQKNVLEFPYFKDAQDEPFIGQLEPGMGLTAYVLRTGRSLLCTQAVHDELERLGEVKLLGVPSKIWLGVPLLIEGQAIGVMVVQHYTDPEAYGVREQNILEFVSSQVAITIQRKQSEQALRESEARYRSLVNGMLDGVYLSTHNGRFIDVNPAMVYLFGYDSREEMLELDIKKDLYFAPEERESLFLDTGQEKVDVFRMKRKDGSEIWVEDHGRYVHDSGGTVIYHEGILRDVTERIRAEREISRLLQESQQRLRHVEALRSIDLAIGSSMDLRTTLNILLSYVKSLLAVDAADILLFNRNSQSFEFAAGNGFRSRVSEAGFHALGRSFASRVALERRVLQFRDPPEAQTNRELSALWKSEGFVTYTGVPLIAKGDLKGVLEIHHRSIFHPETQWTELVQNFSTQAAIAIENTQLFNDLQNTNFELSLAYDATIEGWARALELRENEPPGHFQRVTEMTLVLARAMGVRDSDLVHVRRGALLHDIGKMAIPDPILRKTGPLSEEEWGVMRTHPNHARELLTPIAYLRPALDIPCYHHEKWDGSGYPNGLKGEQIPLAARVFAVADVFDASTSDRFHRKGISKDKALEYIKSESGKHFDPSVVGAFLQLLSKGQLQI